MNCFESQALRGKIWKEFGPGLISKNMPSSNDVGGKNTYRLWSETSPNSLVYILEMTLIISLHLTHE